MVFTIKIQKLQIIFKKSSVLAQKSDKNSLTHDKMKNVCGLVPRTSGTPFILKILLFFLPSRLSSEIVS